jgi:hypothetical protein
MPDSSVYDRPPEGESLRKILERLDALERMNRHGTKEHKPPTAPQDTAAAAVIGDGPAPANERHVHKLGTHDHTGDAGDGGALTAYVEVAGDTMTGNLVHANNVGLRGTLSGGGTKNLALLNNSNVAIIGDADQATHIYGNGDLLKNGDAAQKIWTAGNDGTGSGLDADLLDGLNTASAATASTVATRDANADLTARRYISGLATGTSPLSVASTTVNTNLNADLLDGQHASEFAASTHGIAAHTDRSQNFTFSAPELSAVAGSPTLSVDSSSQWPCWLLDAGAEEAVGAAFAVPDNWASGTIAVKLWLSMVTAQSSDEVRINVRASFPIAHGETFSGAPLNENTTVSVFDTAETMVEFTTATGITVAAGELILFRVGRNGANLEDTATGDMQLYAVEFTFTADQ